jgi:hypothetical protein
MTRPFRGSQNSDKKEEKKRMLHLTIYADDSIAFLAALDSSWISIIAFRMDSIGLAISPKICSLSILNTPKKLFGINDTQPNAQPNPSGATSNNQTGIA